MIKRVQEVALEPGELVDMLEDNFKQALGNSRVTDVMVPES